MPLYVLRSQVSQCWFKLKKIKRQADLGATGPVGGQLRNAQLPIPHSYGSWKKGKNPVAVGRMDKWEVTIISDENV